MKKREIKKRGLSTVVAVLILVLLTVVASGIVYTIAKTIIDQRQTQSENCGTDIIGKVNFNLKYTCWLDTSKAIYFSVEVGDITLDKFNIILQSDDSTKTIVFERGKNGVDNQLENLDMTFSPLYFPEKNSGFTYAATNPYLPSLDTIPKSIRVVPVINGEACSVADTIYDIPSCELIFGP